jgi:hypothetical protein
VNHGFRYRENGGYRIWAWLWGRARTFLIPSPSEPRVSCSRPQISVWEWSLKLAFLSSLTLQRKEKCSIDFIFYESKRKLLSPTPVGVHKVTFKRT